MMKFLFSNDLVTESKKHIAFLEGLHALGVTFVEATATSLRRYEDFWLPLVASTNDDMVPPSDIAWLWHCHRLAPAIYERYTTQRFGRILDPTPAFVFYEATPDDMTRAVWESKYPNEPFLLPEGFSDDPCDRGAGMVGGFDLLGSTRRQGTFLWHVSAPCFQDDAFLKQGVEQYFKFLTLKRENGDLPLVPTFQIDLMWHTHMLGSLVKYNRDCLDVRGERFHHDDSFDDRTPDAPLDRGFKATAALWKKVYDEEYATELGMYRGEPPKSYYDREWKAMDAAAFEDLRPVHVGGSSSSGMDARGTVDTTDDTDIVVSSPFADSSLPGKFKPRTPGRNAREENYVYGRGSMGDGYYAVDTRDAHEILAKRLRRQVAIAKNDLDAFHCRTCLCLGGKPNKIQEKAQTVILQRLARYEDMHALVLARLAEGSPDANIPMETIVAHKKASRKKYYSRGNRTGDGENPRGVAYMYYDSPMVEVSFVFGPIEDVCSAAGCGGGGDYSGGACGGGGCGGGGDGCGGDGGGGCGGGGCGGGGCGGGGD